MKCELTCERQKPDSSRSSDIPNAGDFPADNVQNRLLQGEPDTYFLLFLWRSVCRNK